jgi:hypothetical protein
VLWVGCSSSALSIDGAAPADALAVDGTVASDQSVAPDLAPIVCGGLAGRPCPTGMFCQTKPGQCCCDFQGACAVIPLSCTKQYQPVCGCDHQTYGNDCTRQMQGISLDHNGPC